MTKKTNDYKSITINEHIESKKAKEEFDKMDNETSHLIGLSIASIFIAIIVFIVSIVYGIYSLCPISLILGIILSKYFSKKRNDLLDPLRRIYDRALKNDEIRYDEKIRFLERKRLEIEYNNELTIENIEETLKEMNNIEDCKQTPKKPNITRIG